MSDASYALGHSESELARLALQAGFFERQTRLLFQEAGLAAGQRVFDFGCGVGDVTFLAAKLVGETGQVVGIDRSPVAVQTAQARAHKLGLQQVQFICGDDMQLPAELLHGSFDWLIGRLILLHQPDPVACLQRLKPLLRPRGGAAFLEVQMGAQWHGTVPPSPLIDQVWSWLEATCKRVGIELNSGLKLHRTLRAAGFVAPTTLLTARIEEGAETDCFSLLTELVRSLLPAMLKFGIATEAEVGIDTLTERLRAEVSASQGILVPVSMVGGFAELGG